MYISVEFQIKVNNFTVLFISRITCTFIMGGSSFVGSFELPRDHIICIARIVCDFFFYFDFCCFLSFLIIIYLYIYTMHARSIFNIQLHDK